MGLRGGREELMTRIPPFSSQHLEAACRVLADTERGLSGTQIERLLQEIEVVDTSPGMTKWKRLFNALAGAQNQRQLGNHLIMLTPLAHEHINDVIFGIGVDNIDNHGMLLAVALEPV